MPIGKKFSKTILQQMSRSFTLQLRSVINMPLLYSEINLQLFLFLNNRHWQKMDSWMNLFIYFVKYECKYLIDSLIDNI